MSFAESIDLLRPRQRLAVLLLLALEAGGCARTLEISFRPIDEAPGQYWKDISGAGYDPAFTDSYSYEGARAVLVTRDSAEKVFSARLVAEGLKPNFCYQVKMEGKPWAFWVYGSDEVANEALGYAGRWWRAQPDPGEASDAEYEVYRDNEAYVFIGSLLVDFFVTDENGKATVDLVANSSIRGVRQSEYREWRPGDEPIREYEVGGRTVALYAEPEPSRALPGELVLPSGSYNVQVSLTEESFGDPDGSWARVILADTVRFKIQ